MDPKLLHRHCGPQDQANGFLAVIENIWAMTPRADRPSWPKMQCELFEEVLEGNADISSCVSTEGDISKGQKITGLTQFMLAVDRCPSRIRCIPQGYDMT